MQQETKPNFWALLPLIVFLSIYLIASIIMGDFYKMPITVAFLVSSVVAVAISSGGKLHKRIDLFCKGAANSNIMLHFYQLSELLIFSIHCCNTLKRNSHR